jgi:uncharacterized membrane protein (Fun14 family)
MSESEQQEASGETSVRNAATLVGLTPFKKWLLGVFLVVATVGGAMWTHAYVTTDEPVMVTTETETSYLRVEPPDGSAGFVDGELARDAEVDSTEIETETETSFELPWHGRLGGWLARLGISFAVGLVAGIFFRSFLKTMAALTAVAVAAVFALSYFQVLDVDTDNLRDNYDTAAGWAKGQVDGVKDLVMSFLPSVTASTVGFVVGFLRR